LVGVVLPLVAMAAAPAHARAPRFDVAALGMTTSGEMGEVVKVTVGITSKGPDRFVERGKGNVAVTWRFTPPPGTVTVPPPDTERGTIIGSGGSITANTCHTNREALFGTGPYDCWSTSILEAGESSKGTFYLKIEKVIPNATGTVERVGNREPDANPDNDKASVVVNPDTEVVGSVGGVSLTRALLIGGALLLVLVILGAILVRASGARRRDSTVEWPDIRKPIREPDRE
jgi:hypothetical protein